MNDIIISGINSINSIQINKPFHFEKIPEMDFYYNGVRYCFKAHHTVNSVYKMVIP